MAMITRCQDCGAGIKRRSLRATPYVRCRPCARKYRQSVDYRTPTLLRDGRNCARCRPWKNRAISALYAWRWDRLSASPVEPSVPPFGLAWFLAVLQVADARVDAWVCEVLRRRWRQHRYVEVDHVLSLQIDGGDHRETNLQVLCRRHHARKTRRDLARAHGRRRLPVQALSTVATVLLAGTTAYLVLGPVAAVTPLLVLYALALRTRARIRARRRLHAALAEVTKASAEPPADRRAIRRVRWGWSRVPGVTLLPRPRPRDFWLRYPHTAPHGDPNFWVGLERVARASLGGTWAVERYTEVDRAHFISPDPLADPVPVPWPWAEIPQTNFWDPIPLARDAYGRYLAPRLVGKNLLIGGVPEAGKSATGSMVVAAAALHPAVTLYLADKKRVEFGPWEMLAEGGVAFTNEALLDRLYRLQAEIDFRYEMLLESGMASLRSGHFVVKRKIEPGDGFDPIFFGVDEIASFLKGGDPTEGKEIERVLEDVVRRGRAAGVVTMLMTQIPGHDVIPTSIRNLIDYRMAHKTTSYQMSDQILGTGFAARGYDATMFDSDLRGLGYLLAGGAEPRRCRSCYVPDETLARLVLRALALRSGNEGEPSRAGRLAA